VKAGILSGQFELSGNIMPFWQAYTPAPYTETVCNPLTNLCIRASTVGHLSRSQSDAGIFRWNLLTNSHHVQPCFRELAG